MAAGNVERTFVIIVLVGCLIGPTILVGDDDERGTGGLCWLLLVLRAQPLGGIGGSWMIQSIDLYVYVCIYVLQLLLTGLVVDGGEW